MKHYKEKNLLKDLQPFQRIVVLGTTGVGKSTFSKALSDKLNLPVVELDKFRHGPNWVSTSDDQFRELVVEAITDERWIVDGNYGIARDMIWKRAEAVVWLDYSFTRIFWQLFKRTIRRSISREKLWNGNTENWRRSFFSKDSILLWALKSHPEKKKKYPLLFERVEFSHLKIIKIKHPNEARQIF